jgi:CBS domain-containing protein
VIAAFGASAVSDVRPAAVSNTRAPRTGWLDPVRFEINCIKAERQGKSRSTTERSAAMTTAREIMTADVTCVGEKETLRDAAAKMAQLDVGSLPICGEDDRLKGMLTDRDIVVKALAQGKDPGSTKAGELGVGDGKTVTIGADDSIEEALRTMIDHKVRRLPVIDGRQLVGIISQADLATNVDEERVGDLVEAISAAP